MLQLQFTKVETLSVLSAMITPAILILATSSLVGATSSRLGRVVDRARSLSERYSALASGDSSSPVHEEERAVLFDLLTMAARRAEQLQQAISCLYVAISVFLATSVALGIDAAVQHTYAWIVIGLGLAGVGLLFYASILLVLESRVAVAAIHSEMGFVRRVGDRYAPAQVLEGKKTRDRSR